MLALEKTLKIIYSATIAKNKNISDNRSFQRVSTKCLSKCKGKIKQILNKQEACCRHNNSGAAGEILCTKKT
jgi:hypothetical protein